MDRLFDFTWYLQRNKESAIRLYGDRLDKNRKVKGTNIWFDYYWRIHETEVALCTKS